MTTHVPTHSQQELISSESHQIPDHDTSIDSKTRKKLIIIGVVSVIIVVIIIIVSVTIHFQQNESNNDFRPGRQTWDTGDCGCHIRNRTMYHDDRGPCGEKTTNTVKEKDCPTECLSIYGTDPNDIYYIRNTSDCYCWTMTMYLDLSSNASKANKYCFDANFNVSTSTLDVHKWSYSCCEYGRPYVIKHELELKSDIKYIDCNDYMYYDDDEWKTFIMSSNYSDDNIANKWKQQALSEHASIGTFAKFSLQLMSIGAPLWFIQLSNSASLDEIRHTKISFDVANMYLNEDRCMISDIFPDHEVNIDADWNEIAKDTVIGGCIGETIAAFKMMENKYKFNNIIDDYLYEIAMDEIKHAALAWTTVKWMIHNSPSNVNMDIANNNWWKQQIINAKQSVSNAEILYVYDVVIPSILSRMWMDYSYQEVHKLVVDELQSHLNMRMQTQCVV